MKDMKNIVSAILLEIGNLNMPLLIAVDGRCASGKTILAAGRKNPKVQGANCTILQSRLSYSTQA